MKKCDPYYKCPECGETLTYIEEEIYIPLVFDGKTHLSSKAECGCGWTGYVLFEAPSYVGTISEAELKADRAKAE